MQQTVKVFYKGIYENEVSAISLIRQITFTINCKNMHSESILQSWKYSQTDIVKTCQPCLSFSYWNARYI